MHRGFVSQESVASSEFEETYFELLLTEKIDSSLAHPSHSRRENTNNPALRVKHFPSPVDEKHAQITIKEEQRWDTDSKYEVGGKSNCRG